MATPSRRRREGRNAYYRGGNPDDACPYKEGWMAESRATDWREGWDSAAKADVDVPVVIDFEDVLRRYIDHVGQSEGENYINHLNSHYSDVEFSQDEVAALERLAG